MNAPMSDEVLDSILALQLTVAWAGEGRSTPRRLGWWETDLIDPDGGGDFLSRLLPRTHAWASLEAVREAARRVDAKARGRIAKPDTLRTLFFLGFQVDEQLADRLALLKRGGRPPAEVLPLPIPLSASFSKEKFVEFLSTADAQVNVVPGGRQVKGLAPTSPEAMLRQLAAALVPLSDQYPLPYYALEG